MRKPSFTLAEVLITLGIISVVAALTIPSVIGKYNERATISKYKKMYATLSNAYNLAIEEYGDPINWGTLDRTEYLKRIAPYLSVSEQCYNQKGCTSKGSYLSLSGELMWENLYGTSTMPKILLNNGFSIVMTGQPHPDCSYKITDASGNITYIDNICASVYGIIKHTKSTSAKSYYGKDFFNFYLTRQGVYPAGYNQSDNTVLASCSKKISGTGNGDTCGSWILRHDNMDYLRK